MAILPCPSSIADQRIEQLCDIVGTGVRERAKVLAA
jgi:hypothetical protein